MSSRYSGQSSRCIFGDTTLVLSDIAAEDVAEAVVATGTVGAVAYDVGRGFLAEDFFARLRGVLFVFHHLRSFSGANIALLQNINKLFIIFFISSIHFYILLITF